MVDLKLIVLKSKMLRTKEYTNIARKTFFIYNNNKIMLIQKYDIVYSKNLYSQTIVIIEKG